MASTYLRPGNPYVWIRYKDSNGKWRNANSGFRHDNPGDRRQAKLLAKEKSLKESIERPVKSGASEFREWLLPWIHQKWGDSPKTFRYYKRYALNWMNYLSGIQISGPGAVNRETVLNYAIFREADGVLRNSVCMELLFVAQALDEAIKRGFATTNHARGHGLKRRPVKHKEVWTDEELAIVGQALSQADEFGWMHVTFLMGLYQASRLDQCQVPLRLIDFNRGLINYADEGVKGGKGFSQPIDPDFAPILRAIVSSRKAMKVTTLCDIPAVPSVLWRQFLDSLNLRHLSHHGLRATFITRAALAGVPETMTRRFVNHASTQVHQVYQRITASDLAPIFGAMRQPTLARLPAPEIEATVCSDPL